MRTRLRSLRAELAEVRGQSHPIRYIAASLLLKTGVSPSFVIIQRAGYKLRFYPTALTRFMWSNENARMEDEAFFSRYLRPGDAVIDVGANIGHLSLLAGTLVGPGGSVVAIEAHPRTLRYLTGNIALNDTTNIAAVHCAVGSEAGTLHLSSAHNDDLNAVAPDGSGLTVPVLPLDGMELPGSAIALLKIDVEGYEKYVIEGGAQTLKRTQCIYFETKDAHAERYGYTSNQLIEQIRGAGFSLYKAPGDGRKLVPLENPYRSPETQNVVGARDVEDFMTRTGYTL
ncbi:MAG: FkbM family methyltransferase [Chloroflexota bacterium]